MKRFLGLVKKEFRHIFRDVRTLTFLFGLPVVMLIIFGYVVSNDLKDIRIAVLDMSGDRTTRDITNKIISSGYFVFAGNLHSEKEIENVFQSGQAKIVLMFQHDFETTLTNEKRASLRLVVDAADANSAQLAANYAQGIIFSYFRELQHNVKLPWEVEAKPRMMYNMALKGVYMFVPGLMAMILMLVSTLMTSITITREKELGTMEPLLASPLKPREIILGKVTPYIILSFINAVSIIVLGILVFKVPVLGSIPLLLAESLLYIILALSLGVFISTIAKSQQIAMVISMIGLMLPTILLSGFIFPIENMPDVLQWLSSIMPARWYIVIIKNIMLKGTGFAFVWKETVILMGMSVFFIMAAVIRFKTKLE
jgi:ABC-2 type transport system permease protein